MKPVCDSHDYCPLMKKRRDRVCHTCAWYTRFKGTNPQDGEAFDIWECSIAMLPMLLIENSKEQHNTRGAVIALRDQIHESDEAKLRSDYVRLQALLQVAKRAP